MWDALDPRVMVAEELVERRQAGFDVSGVEDVVRDALEDGSAEAIEQVYVALELTQLRPGWLFDEPSTLDEIRSALPDTPVVPPHRQSHDEVRDRLLGAWLGRCVGCNLGKPVEGWSRERIRRYLELADAYPITDYIPVLEPAPADLQLNPCWRETTRGNVACMARDDDIDYTILGLHVLESWGFGFGTEQVAAEWLDHLPFTQVYTAEQVAYRNLVHRIRPPETASHRNPYREWIGAQIRADVWGYVSPGDPGRASELAFRDASLSHTQNGIYGEMWAAALIACAFVAGDAESALELSLAFVPARSRLAAALGSVLGLHADGLGWEQARDAIEDDLGIYGRVHTINNAALVAAGLLWGAGDFTRTIGLAVQGGWDTDCNGATAGSVFGALHGTGALPGHWVDPLHNLVRSSINGFDNSAVSDLAERTFRLAAG
ncbi:MAG TPA: ADP-ribosylglycohydrolase family protein [Nocardioidaceae bacterium]|jgi:ADP-ribosylglycohydrolase